MATPQQPPPQQPIYPRDLNLALDRNFAKFASYTDGRYDLLAAQLRIGNEESLTRDTDLANAILRLGERMSNIETRVTNIENSQQTIIATLQTMQQKMTEEFAAQAERHNELMARVGRLEHNGQS